MSRGVFTVRGPMADLTYVEGADDIEQTIENVRAALDSRMFGGILQDYVSRHGVGSLVFETIYNMDDEPDTGVQAVAGAFRNSLGAMQLIRDGQRATFEAVAAERPQAEPSVQSPSPTPPAPTPPQPENAPSAGDAAPVEQAETPLVETQEQADVEQPVADEAPVARMLSISDNANGSQA